MAALPLSFINVAVIATVISARNGQGAHSYYNSGWGIKDTPANAHAILPGWLIENGNFTAVFQHTGSHKNKKFSIVFGKYNEEDKTRVSIQTENKLTCEVKEGGSVKNDKSLPLDGIDMEGFHVWRFEHTKNGLEVFLDGRRCVKEGTITADKKEYTVLKGDPAADSPIVVWETHEIIPDITNNFDPKYMYEHRNMKLGIGSYVEFYGDWKEAKGPSIYVEGNEVKGTDWKDGKQLVVLKVNQKNFFVTSSLASKWYDDFHGAPVRAAVYATRLARRLYNLTIVFGEIKF